MSRLPVWDPPMLASAIMGPPNKLSASKSWGSWSYWAGFGECDELSCSSWLGEVSGFAKLSGSSTVSLFFKLKSY